MNFEEWRNSILENISERHKDASKRIDEATKCIFEEPSERKKRFEDTVKEIDAMLESMKNT